MRFFTHKYSWFAGLGIITFLIFFSFRPLNSPQYRLIVADGLGYYSYLPAKFIYHDNDLKFDWFNKVFNKNYEDHLFEIPTQNFLVKYGDRMINLYYPGQSLLQMPFFFAAHISAKLFNYPQDGFSLPYQIGMGISGIFYTLLGLLFCSKLIFNISQNRQFSIIIPLIIFFATNLYTYSIFAGCYTHCYSFCFISLSLFFSERFFSNDPNKLKHFLALSLCSLLVITLRPLNTLLLVSTLYFFKPISLRQIFFNKENKLVITVLLALILTVAGYNMSILYTQTHSFIANTYTIGRFYFDDWSHVKDNFIGFQNGILWYTPLIFLCFIPLFFCFREPKILFLLMPVLIIILLYSFWFYWNIVNRTLVDFSAILAILLLRLFLYFKERKRAYRLVMVFSLLCIPFFQLKAFQLRNGILNNNYTYWRYYAKHFFTLHHVDVFPVNPSSILNKEEFFYDFENDPDVTLSSKNAYQGEKAATLNSQVEFTCSKTYTMRAFFSKKGFKKIKTSFWFYRSQLLDNIHLVYAFVRNDSVLEYHPFYINKSTRAGEWDYKEFGTDLPDKMDSRYKLSIYFWNPEKKDEAFIDNFKLEFILKNGSDEITLDK